MKVTPGLCQQTVVKLLSHVRGATTCPLSSWIACLDALCFWADLSLQVYWKNRVETPVGNHRHHAFTGCVENAGSASLPSLPSLEISPFIKKRRNKVSLLDRRYQRFILGFFPGDFRFRISIVTTKHNFPSNKDFQPL